MLVPVFVPPDVTQPPRRVRGKNYPEHKKTSVREALLKLFQDHMRRGQNFRQLTRTALQPELEAIVRKLTGNNPAEIELNRAGERTSYRNVLRYIFENEFRKGAITTRLGARSDAGRGSPARGFAKILAKTESLDEPVDNTDSNALDDDIRDDDDWADTKDDIDFSPFQHPWKEYFLVDDNPCDDDWNPHISPLVGTLREPVADTDSNSEPVADTDSTSLDDDIRDWADTDDDADLSPFQHPRNEYFLPSAIPAMTDFDWNPVH